MDMPDEHAPICRRCAKAMQRQGTVPRTALRPEIALFRCTRCLPTDTPAGIPD